MLKQRTKQVYYKGDLDPETTIGFINKIKSTHWYTGKWDCGSLLNDSIKLISHLFEEHGQENFIDCFWK